MKTTAPPATDTPTPARSHDEAKLDALCAQIRRDQSVLARAEQMAHAKVLYELIHPETKNGGAAGRAGGGKTKNATVAGFVQFMSSEIGLSPRAITYDVEIATGIVPAVRERISGTPLANSTGELIRIAKLTEPEQHSVVTKIEEAGLLAFRKKFRETSPKPVRKDMSSSLREFTVRVGEKFPLGRARGHLTLVRIGDGEATFSLDRAKTNEPECVDTKSDEPIVDAQLASVVAGDSSDDSQSSHLGYRPMLAGPDWKMLDAAPTDALRDGDAKVLSLDESGVLDPEAIRLLLPSETDPFDAVYGDYSAFARTIIRAKAAKARRIANESGLVVFDDTEVRPGDVTLIAYGSKSVGPWTIGIAQVGDDGEIPNLVFAAAHGDDGKFGCRVPASDEGLGEKLHVWIDRASRRRDTAK